MQAYFFYSDKPKLWEQSCPYDGSVPGDSCRVMEQARAGRAAAAVSVTIEFMRVNVL